VSIKYISSSRLETQHGYQTLSSTFTASTYISSLIRVLNKIDDDQISPIISVLDGALERQARIFVIGNGGSAATASHICSDLGIGLKRRGLANFDIWSLVDNIPVSTALSNDLSYEEVFSAQLTGLLKASDILIALSASGNSPNILRAVELANQIGATVIGCTGFDGGMLLKLSDVAFHVETPTGAYGIVEDAHMVLNHILYNHYAQR
jgi:D-sedoheptulose 7-phosphate isomerase